LCAYSHHRDSNEHQKPAIAALKEQRRFGHVVLHSDWKASETLPIMRKSTGEMYYATARCEFSVFGAALYEDASTSTMDRPISQLKYIIFLTNVLEHTSLMTGEMIDACLECRQTLTASTNSKSRSVPKRN